jgi:outer membrane immunogenic protein
MKLHSGILATALASIVGLASANAADMYRGPDAGGYKDGPGYVGINWSGLFAGVNGGFGWSDRTDALDPTGGFGGGQIGYNIQRGPVVLGLEADIDGSGITDSVGGQKSSLDWFGTVRGKAGYALDRALVYVSGGYAYGQVTNNGVSQFQDGWAITEGVEYKLTSVWSARLEGEFADLNGKPLGGGAGSHTQFSTIRAGVNYSIGAGYDQLK